MNEKALCYNQKFGHDFKKVGDNCSQCGISQNELKNGLQKIEYFVKKPEKGMHSEAHALAKEISEYCGEPKKFGMYLGITKSIGLGATYRLFSQIKQGKNIETPGKLFVYMSKFEPKIPKPKTKTKKNTKRKNKTKKRTKNGSRTRQQKHVLRIRTKK